MMRTRNFRVRSEVVERGSVTKSQKGRKACVERKVGECHQWRAIGQCSKGDSCSFSHDKLVQGDLYGGQRRKGRSSSPALNSKAKTDEGEKNLQEQQATERKTLQTKGGRFRAVMKAKNPSRQFWHPSACQNYVWDWMHIWKNIIFSDMLRLRRSPATSQRKKVRKRQLLYWRSLHNRTVFLKVLIEKVYSTW